MFPVMRFVTRGSGIDGCGPVDLILGAAMKRQTALRPNHIYEVQEILSEMVIRDLGLSVIGPTPQTSVIGHSWMNSVEDILDLQSRYFLLSRTEYATLLK